MFETLAALACPPRAHPPAGGHRSRLSTSSGLSLRSDGMDLTGRVAPRGVQRGVAPMVSDTSARVGRKGEDSVQL